MWEGGGFTYNLLLKIQEEYVICYMESYCWRIYKKKREKDRYNIDIETGFVFFFFYIKRVQ